MRRLLLATAFLLPALMPTFATEASANQATGVGAFTVDLKAANEGPAATGSDLTGQAFVVVLQSQSLICWNLVYSTSEKVTAAHIHQGAAGSTGPVVFGFFNPPPASSPINQGCRTAEAPLVAGILGHPSDYYVNVHTTAHPGGAGRGQLSGVVIS